MSEHPLQQRLAGVLLHPTSLPSGQLDDAFAWIDFMAHSGLRVWQILPLGVPHADRSPYQCLSAFAIDPALLANSQLPPAYPSDPDFALWRAEESHWLEDYALFTVMKRIHHNCAWYHWPDEHKYRDKTALQQVRQIQGREILAIEWQQYQLHRYWQQVHRYAKQHGIFLFGDMPIYVSHDSADVWANRDRFLLDETGFPTVVAGVPPDYFSETGQRWGNPHYNWERMQQQDFNWWLKRLHHHFLLFDLVRIDHFRAFDAAWMIKAECDTAIEGYWQETPGDALLQVLQQEMGDIPLVAEDLGIITPEVTALRKKYHLPGMAVLQFAFDGTDDNPHRAQNIKPDCVVYTGTHDNDTAQGWFNSLDESTQQQVMQQLQIDKASLLVDALIDTALGCEAQLAIIPLQDLLKLGSESRMNIPGTMENNWRWQFSWSQLSNELGHSLRKRIKDAQR